MLMPTVAEVELKVLLAAAAPTSAPAKELIKKVLLVEVRVLTLGMTFQALVAMLIVYLSLFGIRECLIGVCDILELLLGALWIVLVLIGMKLDGHLLEGLLDLIVCGAFFKSEQLIVVLLSGCSSEV